MAAGTLPDKAAVLSVPAGSASQTCAPDNGALLVVFDNAKLDEQQNGAFKAVVLVVGVVPIAPLRSTYIAIDVRGSAIVIGDGQCSIVLTTAFGTTTLRSRQGGEVFGRLRVPVAKTSREFPFTAVAQCQRGSGSVGVSIDSLDLTWASAARK